MKHRLGATLILTFSGLLFLSASARGLLVDLAGHWSAPLVGALEAKGVISGDAFGRFEPEAPLSRAQMAKMIVTSLGNESDAKLLAKYDSRFTDLPGWHWGKGYVEALAELAVTDGYGDGRFGPADTVSRAQMAVFLVRAVGLSEQARLYNLEPTSFTDDQTIPPWARGSVSIARIMGLMTGFEDGSFRPAQPITRAEGAAALLRLEEFTGTAYHLSGTLTQFDPATRWGVVRDAQGNERSIQMSSGAQYFHSGVGVSATRVNRYDQVWIVLNAQGQGVFLEARYLDLLGQRPTVQGSTLQLVTGGVERSFKVQRGAVVFLNGAPAALAEISGAQDVYLALDVVTNEVRVVDAVKTGVQGSFAGAAANNQILLVVNERVVVYRVDLKTVILLNGQKVTLSELQLEDRVRIAVDAAGLVSYLQAER